MAQLKGTRPNLGFPLAQDTHTNNGAGLLSLSVKEVHRMGVNWVCMGGMGWHLGLLGKKEV